MTTARWNVTVREWDHYGHRIEKQFPATVLAANRAEVTQKVRTMFGAVYDGFRHFWSHDWVLTSVEELAPTPVTDVTDGAGVDSGNEGAVHSAYASGDPS